MEKGGATEAEEVEEEWERVEVGAVAGAEAPKEDRVERKQAVSGAKEDVSRVLAKEDVSRVRASASAAQRRTENILEVDGTWGDDEEEDEEETVDRPVEQPVVSSVYALRDDLAAAEESQQRRLAPMPFEPRNRQDYIRQDDPGRRGSGRVGERFGVSPRLRAGLGRSRDEEDDDSRYLQRGGPRRRNDAPRQQNGSDEPVKQAPQLPPQPVEYHKPSWARQGDESTDVVVLKKAKSILNKLTLEKFERLSNEFVSLDFRSVELVAGAIDLIVKKAQLETHFVEIYAELCAKLAATPLAGLGETEKGKKFRRLLLERCQAEFERDEDALVAEIEAIADQGEREARVATLRKIYIGHMFFIGALYKHELLRETIMHHCVQELFGNPDEPDDDKIECLAKLLTTIGKQLDVAALEKKESQKFMKAYFKQLKKLTKSEKLATRIRFLIRDLCDLRDNDWKPRRQVEQAKTIAEIHEDVRREEDEKAGKTTAGGNKKDGKHSAASGKVSSSKANTIADDGWETVGSTKSAPTVASKPARAAPRAGELASVPSSAFGAFASLSSTSSKSDKKKKKKKDDKDKSTDKAAEKATKKADKKQAAVAGMPTPRSTSPVQPTPSINEAAYKAKAKAAIDEYLAIEQIDELVSCVTLELDTMAGAAARYLFVRQALDTMLDSKERDRPKLSPLLLGLASRDILDADAFTNGFLDILQLLPDVIIDMPKATELLGDSLKSLVGAGAVSLDFLAGEPPTVIAGGGDDCVRAWNAFKRYVEVE